MSVTGLGRIAMAEKMSIDQLQKALENKTLPSYIAYPLIEEKLDMQERKKAIQAMQQAQQATLPIAQKIDQRIAALSGIDRLPSNLAPTQGMAGGGIVAFEEGGEVPRYAGPYYGSLVKDPYAQPETQRIPGRGFETPQADPEALKRQLAQIDAQINATPAGRGRVFLENKRNEIRTALGMAPIVGQPRTTATDTGIAPPKVDATLPDTAVAPPPTAPAQTKPKDGKAAISTQPIVKDEGIAAGKSAPFVFEPRPEFPKLGASDAMDVTQGIMGGPTGAIARSEKREKELQEALGKNKMQGKALEGYEQMLQKEGEQAGLDKDQAKYMAMLKAGLAIMSGTSRHALENIGKGAMVGAADYQEAYKDFRKAQRERAKEFALIEQARRAEQRDDNKTANELLMRAADKAQSREDDTTKALLSAGIADVKAARDLAIESARSDQNYWQTKQQVGAQIDIHEKDRASREKLGLAQLNLQKQQVANQAAYYSKSLAITEQRINALDAATKAKYMATTQKILDGMQSDPTYISFIKGLKDRYGDKYATIPEAQRALDGFKKTFVGQQLESMNMLIPAARDATSLLGE